MCLIILFYFINFFRTIFAINQIKTSIIGTHNAKKMFIIKNLSKFIGSTSVLNRPTM